MSDVTVTETHLFFRDPGGEMSAPGHWIFDRLPDIPDLAVTFQRDNYHHYAGRFWTWDGSEVRMDVFEKPPKGTGEYFLGYWRSGAKVVAWQPYIVPDPPAVTVTEVRG